MATMGIWRLICIKEYIVCVCVGGWAGLSGRYSDKSVLTEITWMEACPLCVWVGDSSWSSQEPRLGWTQRELAQEGPGGFPLELQLRRCWFSCWICHTHGTAWLSCGAAPPLERRVPRFEFASLARCGWNLRVPTVPMALLPGGSTATALRTAFHMAQPELQLY